MPITILGLGPGDPDLLTRAAVRRLEQSQSLYLRTAIHPTVAALPSHLALHSFDALYQQANDFATIYTTIAATLVERAQAGEDVLYAVPGDPSIAEATTRHIRLLAGQHGVPVQIMPGVSFLEPVCAALGLDPLEHGLQLIDALDLVAPYDPILLTESPDTWAGLHGFEYTAPIQPFPLLATRPVLICQLYQRSIASDVKLSLLERYPASHPVTLIKAAGVAGQEQIWRCQLHELDHDDRPDHLTSAYLPALPVLADRFGPDGLAYVVARLLGPHGCPWDREQTPQSLRKALLAETYEVLEALDAGDQTLLCEELGDLLMNILAQIEMARQAGDFGTGDVYEAITTKLIRRHPHVFGDLAVAGSGEVLQNWEAIKQAERATKGQVRGTLDGIPAGLPALSTAQELASKAARAGFAWPDLAHALAKVNEELAELQLAMQQPEPERTAESEAELGDLFLALVVVARQLDLDAESALRGANARFRRRFLALEQHAASGGMLLNQTSLATLLELWATAKKDVP